MTIIFSNKMNISLLFIWLKLLLLSLMCFYYNEKIISQYLEMNTPRQPNQNGNCIFTDIPVVDLTSLQKCRSIDNVQSYIYNIGGQSYMVSQKETFYSKACSGFCTKGLSNIGECIDPVENKEILTCEQLIKPISTCVSSAKPIFSVIENSNTIYYYINGPVNSLNSCS